MKCQICGAICVCSKAHGSICCSCHPHKARSSTQAMVREIAHAAAAAGEPMAQSISFCRTHPERELQLLLFCKCGHQAAAHHLRAQPEPVRCDYALQKKKAHYHFSFEQCALWRCECERFEMRLEQPIPQPPLESEEIPACSPAPELEPLAALAPDFLVLERVGVVQRMVRDERNRELISVSELTRLLEEHREDRCALCGVAQWEHIDKWRAGEIAHLFTDEVEN